MSKISYLDMITKAIFEIGDRKGASRDAIWKYLQVKFPESVRDKKIFISRLYKISKEENQVEKSKGNLHRFRLSQSYILKLRRALAKGEKVKSARNNAMTKKTKNPKKSKARMDKVKMSKTVKGKESLKKSKK